MATAFFDRAASRYDELWTNSGTGRLQRAAVWRHIDPLFGEGAHILDIGCGTGEDAVHFAKAGVRVTALDQSPEMVRAARNRGVDARVLAIEELEQLHQKCGADCESAADWQSARCIPPPSEGEVTNLAQDSILPHSTQEGIYDGAISNFGALNCVAHPARLRPLARLIRPGGYLALCIIGRFCLRETIHFLRRGQFGKAVRRWRGASESESMGITVYYPTVRQIERALAPEFILGKMVGIGMCVPPSYIPSRALPSCEAIDRRTAHLPFFRALADHRLLIFRRR